MWNMGTLLCRDGITQHIGRKARGPSSLPSVIAALTSTIRFCVLTIPITPLPSPFAIYTTTNDPGAGYRTASCSSSAD